MVNYRIIIALVIGCCIQFSCKDTEVLPCDPNKFDLVTGLSFTDVNGLPAGQWRIPNDFSDSDFSLSCYPNPFSDLLTVRSGSQVGRVWVLPADCQANCTDERLDATELSLNQSAEELSQNAIASLTTLNTGSVVLDLSFVESGFYKLFMETSSGDIIWYNLYKAGDSNQDLNAQLNMNCSR